MATPRTPWYRWQLTTPFAALSRPIRTRTLPVRAADAGPAGAADATAAPVGPVLAPPAPGRSRAAGGEPDRHANVAGPGSRTSGRLPVLLGGVRARQHDDTSCGSAVLVMLAATGDPGLAEWLETGRLPEGPRPPEIPDDAAGLDVAARFAAAQRRVRERTARRALGPLPWPVCLGTTPWAAARTARFPGVRYRVRPFDDASRAAGTVLGVVAAAVRRGHPVPIYVGGDLRGGPAHAVPRHVVLALPASPGVAGTLQIYEPAAGSVLALPIGQLVGRTEPHPALGGWTHVTAVLLPEPRDQARSRVPARLARTVNARTRPHG